MDMKLYMTTLKAIREHGEELGLTSYDANVLKSHAAHVNKDTGETWLREESVAAECRCSTRQARTSNRKLEAVGLLVQTGEKRKRSHVRTVDVSDEAISEGKRKAAKLARERREKAGRGRKAREPEPEAVEEEREPEDNVIEADFGGEPEAEPPPRPEGKPWYMEDDWRERLYRGDA